MEYVSDYKRKQQITFDLDQNALKQYYPKPELSTSPQYYKAAYQNIRDFMTAHDFVHRQGSSYHSREDISNKDVNKLTIELGKKYPWLTLCVKEIDVTDVPVVYSLKGLLRQSSDLSWLHDDEQNRGEQPTVSKTTDPQSELSDSKETDRANEDSIITEFAENVEELERRIHGSESVSYESDSISEGKNFGSQIVNTRPDISTDDNLTK